MTLIEVLVVLALIGVSAGIVSYALPSGASARSLDDEAELLATRLTLAAERSLVSGVTYRLDWQPEAYGFRLWRDGGWQTADGAPLDRSHALDSGLLMSGPNGRTQGAVRISPALLPDGGAVAEFELTAGTVSRRVLFDGAAARTDGVLP